MHVTTMMATGIRALAMVTVLSALPGASLRAQQPAPWPAATLPNTEAHTFRSAINQREYHVSVALPMRYHRAGADTMRYPVLYVLDGGAVMPLFASMLRITNPGRNGDVIIVGIGHYAPGTFTPPPRDRRRSATPTTRPRSRTRRRHGFTPTLRRSCACSGKS